MEVLFKKKKNKQLKILTHDLAIPLQGIYLEKTLKIHALQCSQQLYLQQPRHVGAT